MKLLKSFVFYFVWVVCMLSGIMRSFIWHSDLAPYLAASFVLAALGLASGKEQVKL